MNNQDSIISYVRKAEDPNDFVVVACNFTPVVRQGYRLGVPKAGTIKRSSTAIQASTPVATFGNYPGCTAEWIGHHGRPASMLINLPPLATVVLKPQ